MTDTLKIKYVERSKLIPYINNARTHSESQVKQIAASIQEFGFTNPILVDENNGIIAGHGRVLAAEALDLTSIPTITLSGLSDAQRKAYVLADNKLALNADWSMELLEIEIQALSELDFDLGVIGFSENELALIVDGWDSNITPPDMSIPDVETFVCRVTGPKEIEQDVIEAIQAAADKFQNVSVS